MAMATIGKTSEITIFLHQGSTLMFYDCEILKNDEHGADSCDVVFTYVSRQTGLTKQALFCTSEIAGFSFARD